MRLLLLPISTRRALIYCEPSSLTATKSQKSYFERAITKATETWASWEKSDTTWKAKTTEYGNRLFRRIPFEEWGLKSIPALKKESANAPVTEKKKVQVRFPGQYLSLGNKSAMEVIRAIATERQDLHKTRLYWSLGIAPFTAPFALVPIIPNIPFFFLAFRAYSHWRALNGSKHLEYLYNNNLLELRPEPLLDSLYTIGLLNKTRDESRSAKNSTADETSSAVNIIRQEMNPTPPAPTDAAATPDGSADLKKDNAKEIMLLRGWNGKLIAEGLQLPNLEIEIERAVEQVEKSLKKQRQNEQQNQRTG